VTFDTNLRVIPMPDRAFIPGVGLPLIEDKCIIEVKYRIELPPIIKLMAETFGLRIQPVSKYRLGLGALDYAPKTVESIEGQSISIDGTSIERSK
jgi:hypothetical protein